MSDTIDYDDFRADLRVWLEENCPKEMRQPAREDADICWGGRRWKFKNAAQQKWLEACIAKGYTVPDWPQAYGGAGLDPTQTKIFRAEMARIKARIPLASFGIWMLGPALLKFGTEEQKRYYLNQIAHGKIRWCQGYSEPGSGSDLVSLQTYGEEVHDSANGDYWLVNGQKIWTSFADQADWIFCLVRTDKQDIYRGITFMMFDMESSGVSTKPIKLISGSSPFCETFFDNVKVPRTQYIGTVNRGWDVAKYLLGHEREMISGGGAGADMVSMGGHAAQFLGRNEHGELDDPMLRAEMAAFDVDSFAYRAMSERFMDMWKNERAHPASSNMMKYAGTELNKRRHELIMAGGGIPALEWDSADSQGGDKARKWLRTKGNSIEGGTSEIMLNVIAKRILELPGS